MDSEAVALTLETATPYPTAAPVRYRTRADAGVSGWRGGRMVAVLGAFKVALVGSAAAVTLAAGGLALSDVFSIMASTGGVLVSAVTLTLMGRKWLRERRRDRHAGVRPPVRPPPLPVTRVTREDYARHLVLWERYSAELERYYGKQLGGEL